MALVLTFLGKGGVGRTTVAIAAAKKLAQAGQRVLVLGQDPSLAWQWGVTLSETAQGVEGNVDGLLLSSTHLLERGWEKLKEVEAQYLRSPALKNIYGEELGVLPGMDEVLVLNALREYELSGRYDVLIYDGPGNLSTLRMLGIPEIASWYWRRFQKVLADSEVVQTLSPFVQPVASAVLSVNWSPDQMLNHPDGPQNLLQQGKAAIADPNRFAAYLVTSTDSLAQKTAQSYWGGAQQVGVTVKGVIQTPLGNGSLDANLFDPLPIAALPSYNQGNWQPLMDALPNPQAMGSAPRPLEIDVNARQVKVFLPGFDKRQVKLTQSGPELTIEAGDQRRNIDLPGNLRGKAVAGAKFQGGYLIVSF
ncbi:Get3/ArsA fold putative tail anchor-mediating ATPase NosAFP [Synechocystis sp. CACIAM 05]|uniref:Get3/ArsA fold putative tail anchor-mediating ATPase NosAFP n=1 Tax=Synechocystis sp. CACIAM 05 TaxID=1933929 RepID=UPI00138E5BC3|nr:ArsA family ATPase [Synechocystis sp. CACIAM 05]QHU98885.1 arsenic-transporting ATPase [Synechocystis sp. CACIAM 05]